MAVAVVVVAANCMHSDSPTLAGNTPTIRNWDAERAHSIVAHCWVEVVVGYYTANTVAHTVWVSGMDKDRWCFPGVGTWP